MDRIGSAKRKRESPDEDEVAEILETVELTRKVVSQVCETAPLHRIGHCRLWHLVRRKT